VIVWVDVETSGLEPETDSLLEVGLIITDNELNEVARTNVVLAPPRGWQLVFKPVIVEMHTKGEGNGLMAECEANGVSYQRGMFALISWLDTNLEDFRSDPPPMAGNSVHFDRAFLRAKMGLLEECFHYRNIDVSSLKLVNRLWNFAEPWEGDRKIHRALPDLEDSVAELRHYRDAIDSAAVAAGEGALLG
jgi:oligoribonuclease